MSIYIYIYIYTCLVYIYILLHFLCIKTLILILVLVPLYIFLHDVSLIASCSKVLKVYIVKLYYIRDFDVAKTLLSFTYIKNRYYF